MAECLGVVRLVRVPGAGVVRVTRYHIVPGRYRARPTPPGRVGCVVSMRGRWPLSTGGSRRREKDGLLTIMSVEHVIHVHESTTGVRGHYTVPL